MTMTFHILNVLRGLGGHAKKVGVRNLGTEKSAKIYWNRKKKQTLAEIILTRESDWLSSCPTGFTITMNNWHNFLLSSENGMPSMPSVYIDTDISGIECSSNFTLISDKKRKVSVDDEDVNAISKKVKSEMIKG